MRIVPKIRVFTLLMMLFTKIGVYSVRMTTKISKIAQMNKLHRFGTNSVGNNENLDCIAQVKPKIIFVLGGEDKIIPSDDRILTYPLSRSRCWQRNAM